MKLWQKEWFLRFGLMGLVVLVWILVRLLGIGFGQILKLWPGFLVSVLVWSAGYQLGWLLVRLDKLMGKLLKGNALVTNITTQWESGVKNIVTLVAMGVLGIWLVTSSGSYIAWGTVLGLQIHLVSEFVKATNYKSWYEVLGRDFDERERKLVKLGLVLILAFQLVLVVRA